MNINTILVMNEFNAPFLFLWLLWSSVPTDSTQKALMFY